MTTLAPKDYDWSSKGVLKEFKQNEFTNQGIFDSLYEILPEGIIKGAFEGLFTPKVTGLMEYGYVFYPNSCLDQSCHIHFLLHGCGGQGDYIIKDTQYAEYAVSNNFIIVSPQITKEFDCHDTYAYTGDNFATLEGV
jgi:hypothetical protein